MLLAAGVAGCAYHHEGPISEHYQRYKVRMPEGDRVFVCSAYGCRTQTGFRFENADIAKLQAMMSSAQIRTATEERRAVAETLAWMEKRVGDVIGTSADRPADDLAGNGDPKQMDCVDVATNLASYLLILERHKLLRHHSVGSVLIKEDLRRGMAGWPHYAAILIEKGSSGQKFAVDGWLLASGKPPEIVETQKWYIDDSDLLMGGSAAPETTGAIAAADEPKRN